MAKLNAAQRANKIAWDRAREEAGRTGETVLEARQRLAAERRGTLTVVGHTPLKKKTKKQTTMQVPQLANAQLDEDKMFEKFAARLEAVARLANQLGSTERASEILTMVQDVGPLEDAQRLLNLLAVLKSTSLSPQTNNLTSRLG